jgi:undecaprenyl-diphosphatase
MEWWQAILLGVVEGVTEFLPVSSTGHILLTQRALGIPSTEATRAFAIVIQIGAIAAVLGLYRARIAQMIQGLLGHDPAGRKLLINVLVAFVPAAVIGKLLNDPIEQVLFGLWPVAAAWLVGGLALLALPKLMQARQGDARGLDALTPQQAALIGLAQCAALWPGTSRSLATIVGGLLLGLELTAAVEFSFLLGLVTLSAAAGYKTLKSGSVMMTTIGPRDLALGLVLAALSAAASVRWMVTWLQRHGMAIFGWYRVALAAVVMALLAAKVLTP